MNNRKLTKALIAKAPIILKELANLKLWLDAGLCYTDAGKTALATANDDKIYTIADQSGNGNDFVQAVEGNRPLFKTLVINGKPAWQIGGTASNLYARLNKSIRTVLGNVGQSASLYVVFKGGSTTGGDLPPLFAQYNAFAMSTRQDHITGYQSPVTAVYSTTVANNTFGALQIYDGTNLTLHSNGVQRAQTPTTAIGDFDSWIQTSGGYDGNTWIVYVSEILLYSSAHTAELTANVYSYLGKKYGISFT